MASNIIPPTGISISFVNSQSFTGSALQQRQFFTDTTNPQYLRHATMTQDGVYLQIYTASVVIPFLGSGGLYAAGTNALAALTWPPIITSQPTSSTVTHPAADAFNVVATAETSINYQWYSSSYSQSLVGSSSALTNAGIFTGVNTSTLNLSSTSTGINNSQFYVICSNVSGATTSSVALLTVL